MTETKNLEVPFRVLEDSAYDRMLSKLQKGSAWEWSFTSMMCEKDVDGNCTTLQWWREDATE